MVGVVTAKLEACEDISNEKKHNAPMVSVAPMRSGLELVPC